MDASWVGFEATGVREGWDRSKFGDRLVLLGVDGADFDGKGASAGGYIGGGKLGGGDDGSGADSGGEVVFGVEGDGKTLC